MSDGQEAKLNNNDYMKDPCGHEVVEKQSKLDSDHEMKQI